MDDGSLAHLLQDLADDPRGSAAFSSEITTATDDLLAANDDGDRAKVMTAWLTEHQPCIFGQMAARQGAIAYCFLTEPDFALTDRHIRSKIATARREWRQAARYGKKHAFIIAALSRRLALAEPNRALMRVALRLAHLYLNCDIEPNQIYHDELLLDIGPIRRRWRVGVNFFSTQGDGRWWQDHRIPGGIAFSMNSVGHMARCARAGKPFHGADDAGGLLWSLTTAMTLIDNTMPAASGRDTWLWKQEEIAPTRPCPYPGGMTGKLSGRNYCQYGGLYHTDQTVPAEYFEPAIEKRTDLAVIKDLDLTYLHDASRDNPDFVTTGWGEES